MTTTSAPGREDIEWASHMLIGGRLIRGDGMTIEVDDPAIGQPVTSVSAASVEQVDAAVLAARRAFDSDVWRDAAKRRACLLALADLMDRHRFELTSMVVTEVGTPIALCESLQVSEPIAILRYFAELATVDRTRMLGRTENPSPSEAVIRYQPSGVVAAVTAYNYPLLFAAVKLGAALAAGW